MPEIHLQTLIRAPRERVFDLSRSIDAHQASTASTGEKAVAGVTSGLIGLGEEVMWEARHFGIKQRLSVKITRMERPSFFQDAMINGAFRSMTHDHVFEECEEGTRMIDRFEYRAPLGFLGRIAEWCFLTAYMRRFLIRRNRFLKELAESDAAHSYLVTNEEN